MNKEIEGLQSQIEGLQSQIEELKRNKIVDKIAGFMFAEYKGIDHVLPLSNGSIKIDLDPAGKPKGASAYTSSGLSVWHLDLTETGL